MSNIRIAITTDDKLTISEHLGTCKYVAIYELQDQNVVDEEFIENRFTHVEGQKDSHDDFIKALRRCDVVISRGIGTGLEKGLQTTGVEVCIVHDEGRLMFILLSYLRGRLSLNHERVCLCNDL